MSTARRMPIIEGIVIPSNWDEQGNIKQVALHTPDEYRVEYGGVGKELLAHIHSRVEATGKIRERLDGRMYINVRSFLTVNDRSE